MEICQSCLTSFDDDTTKDVRFTIWEEVNRQWYLCPDCAAKLQDIVLGFMGEQGPADATTQPKGAPNFAESLENLAARISKHEAEKQSWVPILGIQWYTPSDEPEETELTLTEIADVIENTVSDYMLAARTVRVLRKYARQEVNTEKTKMNNK